MENSQLLKGILEGCVLMVLSKKSYYGYELIEKLSEFNLSITQGTLYPLLLRLESKDLVVPFYEESDVGPKRKYYKITEKGNEEINFFLKDYSEIIKMVGKVIDYYE